MSYPAVVERERMVGEVVAEQQSGIRDFDLSFYDSLTIDESEVERHVESYLGEKLLAPRREHLWIGKDRQLDPNYLQLMNRSIEHARRKGNKSVAERYEKELEGMQGLVDIVVDSGLRGEAMPIVVLASDPGDVYVDQDGRKKSKTFVAMMVNEGEGGWNYIIFDLPTKYIGLNEHWGLLVKLGDIGATEKLLKRAMVELTPNNMISTPVVIPELLDKLNRSLDLLAIELGFENWNKVEKLAEDQLALEGDELAIPRRKAMVKDFTYRIIAAVKNGATDRAKESLVNAMADMFAMEKGTEFKGVNEKEILRKIDRTVKVALAENLGIFNTTTYFAYQETLSGMGVSSWEVEQLWRHRAWMASVFETNNLAQEARATGCGGAGINLRGQGIDSWFGVNYQNTMDMSYAGVDMMRSLGFQEGTTNAAMFVNAAEDIKVSLSGGEQYTLKVEVGKRCVGCGLKSGHAPLVRIGPCELCEHCDPNVHRGD